MKYTKLQNTKIRPLLVELKTDLQGLKNKGLVFEVEMNMEEVVNHLWLENHTRTIVTVKKQTGGKLIALDIRLTKRGKILNNPNNAKTINSLDDVEYFLKSL